MFWPHSQGETRLAEMDYSFCVNIPIGSNIVFFFMFSKKISVGRSLFFCSLLHVNSEFSTRE